MFSQPISSHSILRRLPRVLALCAAGIALLAQPSLAAGGNLAAISNNTFPAIPVGSSETQNVVVSYSGPTSVIINSITLQSSGWAGTEYTLNNITGCTLGVSYTTVACTLNVTYKPAFPGSLASPALSRNATVLITDSLNGMKTFGLAGAATGPLVQVVPGTLARYAGAAYSEAGINPLDNGLGQTTGAYGGDTGQATSANFSFSSNNGQQDQYMTLDSAGNLYVIDNNNFIIRKIDNTANHTVTTIVGTPQAGGYAGDGGLATSAKLAYPSAITLDAAGNIYFLDNTNTSNTGYVRLRKVHAGSGDITVEAGQNYSGSYDAADGGGTCSGGANSWNCGDGGLATYAELGGGYEPGATDLAIDASGNVYLWSRWGATIREINATTGIINTIATAANFNSVGSGGCVGGGGGGMTLASDGNLYVVTMDCTLNGGSGEYVIKEYNITNSPGTVTTVAGGGTNVSTGYGSSGQEGIPAGNLYIYGTYGGSGLPTNLASDASGNLYLPSGQAVFRINLAAQTAYCIMMGNAASGSATNTEESFNSFSSYYDNPFIVIPGFAGNLYVMTFNQIAEITGSNAALYMPNGYSSQQDFSTSADQIVTYANVGNVGIFAPALSFVSTGSSPGTNFSLDPSPTIPSPPGGALNCTNVDELNSGNACTLYLQFIPTVVGAMADTLDIGSPTAQTVSLSGNGTAYPRIGLNTTSLSFGNVTENTSAILYVTITNTGTASLTVNNLFSNGTNPANFVVATGGSSACTITGNSITLTAGNDCMIKVTFTPTAVASYSAYLEGAANTTASSSTLLNLSQYKLIPFTGAGVSAPATAPAVSISPASYVFPATNVESGYLSGNGNPAITLTNTGNAPLTFTGSTPFTITNAGTSSPISVYPNGSCTETYVDFSTPMPANGNCNITVQFWPQKAGVYAATLSVADNAANSPQTITLNGIGKAGQLQFAPAQLNVFAGAIGNGNSCADTGNGNAATGAQLCTPSATAADMTGNIYIADPGKNVVRMVNSSGNISDFAGNAPATCVATSSSIGDGCAAANATLNNPTAVAVDGFGNVYISDTGNARVRVVNAVTGMITTYAGNGGTGPFTAGAATSVHIVPNGIALDQTGNLYIADAAQNIVIWVVPSLGGSSPYASVFAGGTNDGTPMYQIGLNAPNSVAVDLNGDLFIADTGNNLVRELVNTGDGDNVTIFAGTGTAGNTGDNGPATSAEIHANGVAVDVAGDLYISTGTSIRMVNLAGTITTLAGGGGPGILPAQATSVALVSVGLPGIDLSGDMLIPSGTGVAMAGPQGNLVFGSTNEGSTSAALTVTITNTGNAAVGFYNPNEAGAVPGRPGRATVATGAQSGAASEATPTNIGGVADITGDFAVSGGTCTLTTSGAIAAGASCTINVTFSPTQIGARTGNITLYADGPYTIPAVINLSGTGTGAALTAQTITFSNPGAQTVGTPLALTATATSSLTVAFSSTTTGVCTVSGTQATFLTTGICTIDANQGGNSTYAPAPMVPQSFTVNAAPLPSFNVVSSTPPQTVQPGGAAQYTINVNPVNGSYTGAVTLSVVQNTLPAGATAGFSFNPVTPGSAGATSMLTIQTAAQTASAKSSAWPLAAPALSLIGLFLVPGKRRRRWLTLAVLLFASLGALTALSACGGGFQLPGVASTSHSITVNGANTSGAIVSSTTVQLTVQ